MGIDAGWFRPFLEALEKAGIFRSTRWWENHGFFDRALEAILITQFTREQATASLLCLKFHFEAVADKGHQRWNPEEIDIPALLAFGRAAGRGGKSLVRVVEKHRQGLQFHKTHDAMPVPLLSAVFALKFYMAREATNLPIQSEWTNEALDRVREELTENWPYKDLKPYLWKRKSLAIRSFLQMLKDHGGYSPLTLEGMDDEALRDRLLEIPGIGQETADVLSIYFFGCAQAVLDKYFWNVIKNHGWVPSNHPESYKADRRKFLDAIHTLANERKDLAPSEIADRFHMGIDEVAKRWCRRKNPDCQNCAILGLPFGPYH
ncbi:MAG: hypothetical protein JW836_13255 [Deltaproteobacteria bacterium]|nr:hypothetical protein [Deltaproteobacteria bacterium]